MDICKKKIKKYYEKSLKILLIFLHTFSKMARYWLVFLYRKDTNPVLKYLVFVKTSKKV